MLLARLASMVVDRHRLALLMTFLRVPTLITLNAKNTVKHYILAAS